MPGSGPYCVMLADDHALLRKGLKKILEGMDGVEVVGEAGDGLDLLSLMKTVTPHLVILDISMPNLRGIEAIDEIRALDPEVRILILTMHKDKEYLSRSLSAGAHGYLLKEDADTELFTAIEKIRKGKLYVSPYFSDGVLDDWAQASRGEFKAPFQSEPLTNRERQILKLIAEGKSNKDIAELLFISGRTVEHHRANMMSKLSIRNTADLVKYAIQMGYV